MTLCFATNNLHKLQEVKAIVGSGIALQTLREIGCLVELPETHDTIRENAIEKADYVWSHYHVPCFADDSGLEVDALDGKPGVHSAFYAGPQKNFDDNVNLLLKNLEGVTHRTARFRSVIALRTEEGLREFEGVLPGTIIYERKGEGGFGYDPVFLPDGEMKTLAEMTMEEKNLLSHRSVAVRKLTDFLLSCKA